MDVVHIGHVPFDLGSRRLQAQPHADLQLGGVVVAGHHAPRGEDLRRGQAPAAHAAVLKQQLQHGAGIDYFTHGLHLRPGGPAKVSVISGRGAVAKDALLAGLGLPLRPWLGPRSASGRQWPRWFCAPCLSHEVPEALQSVGNEQGHGYQRKCNA